MPAYADLVHQTSTTTGAGNLTLTAVNGKRTFLAAFGTGGTNTFDYYVSNREAAEWERGTGHETAGALVRDTVLASSNANAAVAFSAGVKDVTNDQPADKRIDKLDAAPLDALAYSGMQINGGMEVSQERGLASTFLNQYVLDGWQATRAGPMITPCYQSATGSVGGFPYGLVGTVTTAAASLGANDYQAFFQFIEGWRTARLGWGAANAKPITLAFWTWHHRVGIYSGTIRNGAANRSYAFSYTQAAADVLQYNVITIPGDTTGTWAVENTVGMIVTFSNGAGTTFTAPSANTWLAGNYQAAPGQVNGVAATSDVFRITGVVVLPGIHAPTAAQSPLIMRPYDQELMVCRRYYTKIESAVQLAVADGNSMTQLALPVSMRAVPTVTASGSATWIANGTDTIRQATTGAFAATILKCDARL